MSDYQILGNKLSSEQDHFQNCVKKAYESKNRPLCLCHPQGIPMYIAKVAEHYIIKRMPNTGKLHNFNCASYEPPEELSGRGQLDHHTIQEDIEKGITTLKLGFSLSKHTGKQIAHAESTEKDTVKTDGTKLTILSTLHYLWEQARFNRYTPKMYGKRNWYVIRKYLLEAAFNKMTKGKDLYSLLYIPEVFNLEKKDEISQRRRIKFNHIATASKNRQLMIIIAEVKEIAPARYGHKIIFKQLPDCHFMMNEDLFNRINNRFQNELDLWNGLEKSHLIAMSTFSLNPSGIPLLEEITLMNVSEQWIPFEGLPEYQILSTLVETERSFIKGLRYNMPKSKSLATAVLSDTEKATALYIETTDQQSNEMDDLVSNSDLLSWRWNTHENMPPLPIKS